MCNIFEERSWNEANLAVKSIKMYLKPWTKKQIDHVVSQVDKTTIIIYDEQEEEDKKNLPPKIV